jgi:hypothetical protein
LQLSAFDGENRSEPTMIAYQINGLPIVIVNSTGPLVFSANTLGDGLELNLTLLDDDAQFLSLRLKFDSQTVWSSWESWPRGFGSYRIPSSKFTGFLADGMHTLCIRAWDETEEGPPVCLNYTILPSATLVPRATATQLSPTPPSSQSFYAPPTPPPSDGISNDDSQGGGLSPGAIGAIVGGAVAAIVLCAVAAYCLCRRTSKGREDTTSSALV